MKKTFIISILTIIFIISLSANIYSFNQLSSNEKINSDIEKYDGNEKTIDQLKEQDSSKEIDPAVINTSTKQEEIITETSNDVTKKELSNTAIRFVEFAFNSDPEMYVTKKQNAHNYMTENLIETLFASDGTDEVAMNLRTDVDDIKVYFTEEIEEGVIVSFYLERELLNIDIHEVNEYYVRLKFTTENDSFKVSELETITVGGA